jgi:hypothetical protein
MAEKSQTKCPACGSERPIEERWYEGANITAVFLAAECSKLRAALGTAKDRIAQLERALREIIHLAAEDSDIELCATTALNGTDPCAEFRNE